MIRVRHWDVETLGHRVIVVLWSQHQLIWVWGLLKICAKRSSQFFFSAWISTSQSSLTLVMGLGRAALVTTLTFSAAYGRAWRDDKEGHRHNHTPYGEATEKECRGQHSGGRCPWGHLHWGAGSPAEVACPPGDAGPQLHPWTAEEWAGKTSADLSPCATLPAVSLRPLPCFPVPGSTLLLSHPADTQSSGALDP